MTEMIVYENFDASQRAQKENIDLLYMNDLVHGNMENSLFNLEEWLLQSGINCKGPFCVGIFSLIEKHKSDSLKPIRDTIIKKDITKALKSKNILCASNGEFYIALSNHSPSHFAEIMDALSQNIQQNDQHTLLCTIGNEYSDFLDISKSYSEALIIKRHFENQESGVFCFSNIVLDFVISQIPGIHKKNLFEQVFKDCTAEEICEYKEFIISYFECNGSLVQLAEKNFIHKNTVQYKINKIFRSTRRDLRKYSDLFILYLAARQLQ
jgi:carbohydrate diacid regulator